MQTGVVHAAITQKGLCGSIYHVYLEIPQEKRLSQQSAESSMAKRGSAVMCCMISDWLLCLTGSYWTLGRSVKVYPAKDSMWLQNESSIVTCRLSQ